MRASQQLLQFQLRSIRPSSSHPAIAPSNLHLFLHLKKHLASQKFHKDKEVKNEVTLLCAQAAEFCDVKIQKCKPRLHQCLDKGGDYVEK
jgi:hypothetical protein